MTNKFFESSSIRTFFHKTFESASFQNDSVKFRIDLDQMLDWDSEKIKEKVQENFRFFDIYQESL